MTGGEKRRRGMRTGKGEKGKQRLMGRRLLAGRGSGGYSSW